jgi:hypothetical protein
VPFPSDANRIDRGIDRMPLASALRATMPGMSGPRRSLAGKGRKVVVAINDGGDTVGKVSAPSVFNN